jgi:hypothetical protein
MRVKSHAIYCALLFCVLLKWLLQPSFRLRALLLMQAHGIKRVLMAHSTAQRSDAAFCKDCESFQFVRQQHSLIYYN